MSGFERASVNGAPLGHNPEADEAERLRVRATFNLREHLQGKSSQAVDPPPVHITREQVLMLCQAYGIDVIQQGAPGNGGGRKQNLEEKIEALKIENEDLIGKNRDLLVRSRIAEEAAANAIKELDHVKRGGEPPPLPKEEEAQDAY